MGRTRWQQLLWDLGELLALTPAWRLVLRYEGEAPGVRSRYVNRINGHLVTRISARATLD